MKRFMMIMWVMILCIATPMATFAQNAEEPRDDFHIVIDAMDNSEQVWYVNTKSNIYFKGQILISNRTQVA
jgi:hypothetical protein